jgi:hypothetical protein
MNISDRNGEVGVPHVWTDANWRKGLDCSYQLLHQVEQTKIPLEYYGIANIIDEKIAKGRDLRIESLIGRFKGCHWLFKRAIKNPTEDNYDPLITVWRGERKIPNYPGADENGALYCSEAFWGFLLGFDERPIEKQELVQRRFSQTLFANNYSFEGIPPFLAYCRNEGQESLRELGRLAPYDRRIPRLFRAMASKQTAA